MKKTYIYLLFSLMVIAQIAASAQIVYNHEAVITTGNVYKFKTAPIDPSDPFRGKYITLRFDINHFEISHQEYDYNRGVAYAYFSKDAEGFAVLENVSKEKLANSKFDYVKVETTGYYGSHVTFNLPFDRYYMEESKAYDAELLYRENNRRGEDQDVYAVVHIENGTYVLTDVVVNGISIKDAVEE